MSNHLIGILIIAGIGLAILGAAFFVVWRIVKGLEQRH